MTTKFLMRSAVALALLGTATGSAIAQSNPYQRNYQQRCATLFIQAGYSVPGGGFGYLCSPITNEASLQCVQGLVRNLYRDITNSVTSGCGMFDSYPAAYAVQAVFNNKYDNVTYELLSTISYARTWDAANCVASIFNSRYSNVTPAFITSTCY